MNHGVEYEDIDRPTNPEEDGSRQGVLPMSDPLVSPRPRVHMYSAAPNSQALESDLQLAYRMVRSKPELRWLRAVLDWLECNVDRDRLDQASLD